MEEKKLDINKLLKGFDENRALLDRRYSENVEKYRKGGFKLKFGSCGERKIKIRQIGHKFLFGCNAFMLDCFECEEKEPVYREKFARLFNQAVVPFYWSALEPTEGKPRYRADSEKIYRRPAPDVVLDFCREYGIQPKGHCLAWQHSNPDWLKGRTVEEKMAAMERRFASIAAEYGDRIPSFDIINESPSHYNLGRRELFEGYDEYALELGAKYFAGNIKIANETNTGIWASYTRSGKYMLFNTCLKDWLAKGYAIDEIGLQYHLCRRENELEGSFHFDISDHLEILELLSEYKLPMHISEITIPSYMGLGKEYEEFQAKLTEEFYRLWFATPSIKSIVWWNLVDGYAAYAPRNTNQGENYYGGGLLHYDMSEKPAYKIIDRLINSEWKTAIDDKFTGDAYSFRGFYGEYEIEITDGDRCRRFTVTLDSDGAEVAI